MDTERKLFLICEKLFDVDVEPELRGTEEGFYNGVAKVIDGIKETLNNGYTSLEPGSSYQSYRREMLYNYLHSGKNVYNSMNNTVSLESIIAELRNLEFSLFDSSKSSVVKVMDILNSSFMFDLRCQGGIDKGLVSINLFNMLDMRNRVLDINDFKVDSNINTNSSSYLSMYDELNALNSYLHYGNNIDDKVDLSRITKDNSIWYSKINSIFDYIGDGTEMVVKNHEGVKLEDYMEEEEEDEEEGYDGEEFEYDDEEDGDEDEGTLKNSFLSPIWAMYTGDVDGVSLRSILNHLESVQREATKEVLRLSRLWDEKELSTPEVKSYNSAFVANLSASKTLYDIQVSLNLGKDFNAGDFANKIR